MKRKLLCFTVFIITGALAFAQGNAQPSPANLYLERLTEGQEQITEDFLSYTSAVAHGKTAKKIEKRRKDLIAAVAQARERVKHTPAFEGDTNVRSAAYNYYVVDYNLLNNDYAKIVDMEEIAEQSYDNMEAYLMAQEKAEDKLHESYARWDTAFHTFAKNHDIKIVEDNSKVSKKAELAHKVNEYYHKVYLLFFKSYKEEMYLTAAVEKKDLNSIEQSKNALLKSTTEGFEKLNKVPAFEEDADLTQACRKALQFYQHEAKNSVAIISDFLLKNDNFAKLKKAMDGKGDHSQQEVDDYNKAVRDINAAVNTYNRVNKEDNEARGKAVEEWNNGGQSFLSKHTPRYNK